MGHTSNPDWYRAKYSLAAEYANWALSGKAERPANQLRKAEECLRELLGQIGSTLRRRPWGLKARNPEVVALRRFIADDVAPNARVLLAGIELAQRTEPQAESKSKIPASEKAAEGPTATVRRVAEESPDSPDLNYNLACFYAQAGEPVLARQYLQAAVKETSPAARPRLAERIARDPVLADVIEPSAMENLMTDFLTLLVGAISAVRGSAAES